MSTRKVQVVLVTLLCAMSIVLPIASVRAEEAPVSSEPIIVTDELAQDDSQVDETLVEDGATTSEETDSAEIVIEQETVPTDGESTPEAEMTDEEYIAYLAANDMANSFRFSNGVPIAQNEAPLRTMRLMAKTATPPAWSYTENGWVSSNGQVIQGAIAKGIDVSEWNTITDWSQVKADGISFAILRVGYSTYIDDTFEQNAQACERLGIPYGVYVYSYASNAEQAAKEAEAVIKYLKGHKLSYPVYIDIEDLNAQKGLTAADFAAMATAFCTRIQQAGYEPGVYSMLSWWDTYFTSPVFDNWSKWIAQYYSTCEYEGSYRIWQCSGSGSVAGISGAVDINFEFGTGAVVKPEGLAAKSASGTYGHPIAAGEYNILSAMDSNKVIDTYDNASYAGANIQLWAYTNGGGDRFKLSVDSRGLYTIQNVNSGKCLSLSGFSGVYSQNVVQMDPTGTLEQKWIIETSGSGYTIRSAFNTDYVLDLYGATTDNGTNIGIWTKNGNANQRWTFRSLDYAKHQTVADGVYSIACSGNRNIVLGIDPASSSAGSNVGFWTGDSSTCQQFKITYAGNGYYTLTCVKSGLALDVAYASKRNDSNVLQWTLSNSDNQLWAIVNNGDGSFSFVGKGSGLLLTASGGASAGSNAAIGPMDYSSDQRFYLSQGSGQAVVDPRRPIANGIYYIESLLRDNFVIDVAYGSADNGANILMWQSNGGGNQQWEITWDESLGAYAIKCVKTGKYLDAAYGKAENGTNVVQWAGNGGINQRWQIVASGSGYQIRSAINPAYVIDIAYASTNNGANVLLWSQNDGANQRYRFVSVNGSSGNQESGTAQTTTGRVVPNGTYEIALASNPNLVLDVAGPSTADRTNICIWTDHNGSNQRFVMTWDAAQNSYKISSVYSGSVLDLAGSRAVVGANIQQYHAVDWLDQRWIVTKTSGGYLIASAVNPSYYLCLNSASPAAGSNVQLGRSSDAVLFSVRSV